MIHEFEQREDELIAVGSGPTLMDAIEEVLERGKLPVGFAELQRAGWYLAAVPEMRTGIGTRETPVVRTPTGRCFVMVSRDVARVRLVVVPEVRGAVMVGFGPAPEVPGAARVGFGPAEQVDHERLELLVVAVFLASQCRSEFTGGPAVLLNLLLRHWSAAVTSSVHETHAVQIARRLGTEWFGRPESLTILLPGA